MVPASNVSTIWGAPVSSQNGHILLKVHWVYFAKKFQGTSEHTSIVRQGDIPHPPEEHEITGVLPDG